MFIAKCKDLYGKRSKQEKSKAPFEEQLRCINPWLDGCTKKYDIEPGKPNKIFTFSQ